MDLDVAHESGSVTFDTRSEASYIMKGTFVVQAL